MYLNAYRRLLSVGVAVNFSNHKQCKCGIHTRNVCRHPLISLLNKSIRIMVFVCVPIQIITCDFRERYMQGPETGKMTN